MRSVTLETIRLLNRWSEYLFGKPAKSKDDTPDTIFKQEQKNPQIIPLFLSSRKAPPKSNSPKTSIYQKIKSAKLVRLPSYKGDADEQYKFGELISSTQNYYIAYLWFRLAAKQGHEKAQFKLGVIYCQDEIVKQNYIKALKWIRLSAEQGHAEAQFLLGAFYEEGERIKQDYAKAVKWFKRSAEQGCAIGQSNYAWMLIRGDGIQRNNKEGFKWYKLAAEQGVAKAQFVVGLAYFYGDWPSIAKQNYQEAVKWLSFSADQGNPNAQFYLGKIYHQGGILDRGQQNEFEWRKISDKDRVAEKQLDLWVGDNTKDEVAQDFGEAIKWYRLAADQDKPDAQYNLGLMYLKGQGVSQDHEKGIDLIERASEKDHPAALYHLGLVYDLGDGVEPDDEYSNWNYEIAAENGHSGARYGMIGDGSQNYRGN